MESLRTILLIAGGLAILGVLVHGLRNIKREQAAKIKSGSVQKAYQPAGRTSDEPDPVGPGPEVAAGTPFSAVLADEVADAESAAAVPEPESNLTQEATQEATQGAAQEATQEVTQEQPNDSPEPVTADEAAEIPSQLILVVNIIAQAGRVIEGPVLAPALESAGFRFGDMDIYHYHQMPDSAAAGDESDTAPAPLFSVINMMKPGTFDPGSMDTFTTQGISLFMVLPGPGEGLPAFGQMYEAAQALARELDADLLDDQRLPLTRERVKAYCHRIIGFEDSISTSA